MKKHLYLTDIMEICRENHLTVDEIFEKMKEIHSSVGRSTIYRNVEELAKDGALAKISGVGEKTLYELNKGSHVHIIDSKTGEIKDIDFDLDSINIPGIPEGFKVESSDIKIFGNFK